MNDHEQRITDLEERMHTREMGAGSHMMLTVLLAIVVSGLLVWAVMS